MSRFKHIEVLILCAEMTWAVHEAHQEVLHHVLHGKIVDTQVRVDTLSLKVVEWMGVFRNPSRQSRSAIDQLLD